MRIAILIVLLFVGIAAAETVDLAMLDLDMQPEITVKLKQASGGAPGETYYILLEAGTDVLLDESSNKLILE